MTPFLERLRGVRPTTAAGVFIGLVGAVHTLRVAYFAARQSFFFGWGDDIGGFWLAKSIGFFKYLFSPIDVHRVPLLRLVSYFIFRLAPLRFEPAELVLLAFHAAGCVLLFKALEQIRKTPANYVLVAWCTINPYLGSQLFWWTAGAARLPYIFFSNAAAYGYLKYRAGGSRRWAALVVGSLVLSLGFFAKAVLIPVNLAALELVLRFTERGRPSADHSILQKGSRLWGLLGALATLSALYVLAWRAATPARLREASLDPGFLSVYFRWTWEFFGLGTAGLLMGDWIRAVRWVGAAWAIVVTYSTVRSRGAALVAWAAAGVVLTASIFAGTSSARAHAVGPFMAVAGDRYYFELMPLLVLFAGAAFRNFEWGGVERALLRRSWVRWVAAASAACAFVALAEQSYRRVERLFANNYADFADARIYFENLREGMQKTSPDSDKRLPIASSDIPIGLVFYVPQPRTSSQLLWLMGFSVKGTTPRPGAYWVTRRGHVYRL